MKQLHLIIETWINKNVNREKMKRIKNMLQKTKTPKYLIKFNVSKIN